MTLEKSHELLKQCYRKANYLTKQNEEKLIIERYHR